jgi:hypothetical protein
VAIGILWAVAGTSQIGGEVSTYATRRLTSPAAPKVQVKADEAKAKSAHQKCRGI